MTQFFREDGRPVPVTVIQAGPCTVVGERTVERDGYRAIQLGFEERKPEDLVKPLQGYFAKLSQAPKGILKEFRLPLAEAAPGATVTVEIFKPGDRIDVTGRSIGKGFSGGVKRWNWKGGNQTHGSMTHRRPGSIGSSTTPSRVFKGHHMPGRMGGATVTVQALEVIRVDAQENLLLVKGAVPGADEGVVVIHRSRKKPKVPQAAPKPKKKAVVAVKKSEGAAKPAAKKPAAPSGAAKKKG